MLRWFMLLLLIVALILGIMVGVLNPDPVKLDLLFWELTGPAGMLLVAVFVGGLLCGLLVAVISGWLRRAGARGGTPSQGKPGASSD
ncbi:MAG: hypothetical protein Kow0020_12790 [Wenzhouxiangellaceae bacterium]